MEPGVIVVDAAGSPIFFGDLVTHQEYGADTFRVLEAKHDAVIAQRQPTGNIHYLASDRCTVVGRRREPDNELAPKTPNLAPDEGRKDDSGKLRWTLLPFLALEEVVKVLEFGARKYAPDNWRKVPNARARYTDAAIRHLVADLQGERNDSETGLSHLAHAMCCLLFRLEFELEEKRK